MLTRSAERKMHCRRVTAAVLLAGCLVMTVGRETRAAGLLIADGGLGGVLEIDEHTVKVTIK